MSLCPPSCRSWPAHTRRSGEAYNRLGQAAAEAGPLDVKTEHLVKLALAVGAGREGAVHSHVRRGQAAGLTREELRRVALLAITTIGWPAAVAALSWIEDAPGEVPEETRDVS